MLLKIMISNNMDISDTMQASVSSVFVDRFIISLSDSYTKFSDATIDDNYRIFFFGLRGDFIEYVKRK